MSIIQMTRISSASLGASNDVGGSNVPGDMNDLDLARLDRWRRRTEAKMHAELQARNDALRQIDAEHPSVFQPRSA